MLNGNREGSVAEKEYDLRERTLQFGLRILKFSASLPNTPEARSLRWQVLRCGTSQGAQYREACRARSPAEFISKIESAQQELDETDYWITLAERAEMVPAARVADLKAECAELMAIFASSARTAKGNQ